MPHDMSAEPRSIARAPREAPGLSIRTPNPEDGPAISELIRACRPLDENSMYCNLLQCCDFADTCVVAELDGRIAGWISGYVKPADPQTIFVWQVAVREDARGRGLGRRMLAELLDRDVCRSITRLQTTITSGNAASWALFTRFADRGGADIGSQPHFRRHVHFAGAHATEHMVTIELAAAGARKAA